MDEKDIRKYAKLMEELGLTGIEVDPSGTIVRLERSNNARTQTGTTPAPAIAPTEKKTESAEEQKSEDYVEITSPLVGVFYASAAVTAKPFVEIGAKVKKGDVVCIIEAMKLMNEIVAEEDGIVAEICAENNQVVEFGQTLFKLRKEA